MNTKSALLPLLIAIVACSSGTETDNPAHPKGVTLLRSTAPLVTDPEVTDEARSALESGMQSFAADLYREVVADSTDNVVLSPFSVFTALCMTYAGAGGTTQGQFEDVMYLGSNPEEVHPALNQLTRQLADDASGPDIELELFDSLWLANDLEPRSGFLDVLAEHYDAGVFLVDFAANPETARQNINNWVKQRTRDTISDLLPKGSIDELTRFVLSNALYFAGPWAQEFPSNGTGDGTFTTLDGSEKTVPFMGQLADLPVVRDTAYDAVELGYRDSSLALVAVLPAEDTFEAFETDLDGAMIEEVLQALDTASDAPESVYLSMPRFSFATPVSLIPALRALGLVDAFEASADFSRLSDEDIYLTAVEHQAYIAVNEWGTVASAATAVVASRKGSSESLVLNRPFLFFLVDQKTHTLLFMGRVLSP